FAAACISGDREKAKGILARIPGIVEKMGLHRRIEMLHRAVEGRRLEGIRLMAELGFEVSGQTKHDNVGMLLETTPLHNAAWMGDLEMVKLLIELGADATIRDQNYNATPLGWAEYNNKQNVVEYLNSLDVRKNG
ncbi:MAG TPA: ankyrin repeat domain-containing protein, partial [Terriglobales bacterium]